MENTDFDEAAWISQCEPVVDQAVAGCGSSFDVYQQRVSASIDGLLHGVAQEHLARAVEVARSEFDYATPEELAQAQQELADMGYCTHGIDPDCCPCGCGDIEA